MEERKSILIEKELHEKLKEKAKLSGISMKNIVEMGIELIFKRIKLPNTEEEL